MTRDQALAKVGRRVQLCDIVDEVGDGGMYFSKEIPAGTTGTVIHANLAYRFIDPEGTYEPCDIYTVVIEWDLPDRRIKTLDKSACDMFITEL